MASFQTTASCEHKERLLQNRKAQQKQIKIIIDGLDVSVFGVIHEIRCVASAANLSDTQKVLAIQALLDREHTKPRCARSSCAKGRFPWPSSAATNGSRPSASR